MGNKWLAHDHPVEQPRYTAGKEATQMLDNDDNDKKEEDEEDDDDDPTTRISSDVS